MDGSDDRKDRSSSRTILLVDDDDELLFALTRSLSRAGFKVLAVPDAEHALEEFEHAGPDLLLTDLRLPGRSGLDLAEAIRRRCPCLPILIQSAFVDDAARAGAKRVGAIGPLMKPVSRQELLALLVGALNG